ncbi:DinB family protein [Chryseobacterium formosus]|uniref:DinB family protein n=1 Tax=Chryseobacterium formosus TaxID=1537363 RepID=A0ABT3XRI5_9FLAO|nr:DinB family protein [Chryseobacterium formosus]MCX8524221.1 DinB family protein [Chryseobacterium formosus]
MDIFRLIQDIRRHLKFSFDEVDGWFDKDNGTLNFQPSNGGWTVQQILEHIYLTNFYLLILIEKGSKKAMRNYLNLDLNLEIQCYSFNKEKFEKVGEYGAFDWIRPEHMEPKGELNLSEIRNLISRQYHECLNYLDLMKNGEGLLCKTTMTVNELVKINVYEYIYFLSLHTQRHVTQMKNNELENIKN